MKLSDTLKGSEYYEEIRGNQSLMWLLRQTDLVDGMNPLEEYDMIKQQVCNFEKTAVWVNMLVLGTYLVLSVIAILVSIHYSEIVVLISIVAALVFLWYLFRFMEKKFTDPWHSFIRIWISEHWQSQDFTDEVNTLVKSVTNGLGGFNLIHHLEGSLPETRRGCVPEKVIEGCRKYLANYTKLVVERRLQKKDQEAEFQASENKMRFEVFQKFKIIPTHETLGPLYTKAERDFKQAEKSANI